MRKKNQRSPTSGAGVAVQTILPLDWPGGRRGVGIVDDHPMTRAGIAQLLNTQADLYVAFEAGSPHEALEEIGEHPPDLLLTDMSMEGRSGLEFIKDVKALYPRLPVLVLSMHDEQIHAERALRSGALGYVTKDQGGDVLLLAIRRVLSGDIFVSPALASRLLRTLSGAPVEEPTTPIAKLTDREFEVLQLIGQGKSTREIATQLHISTKTVDVHRSRMREKLALPDANALMRFAVRWVESNGP